MQSGKKPIFVIQKHDASCLHFDFRFEINKTLVSWAVPKSPLLNQKERRLAIRTDDHPLSYATFEGVIPSGSYGAGTVTVWDIGTYTNIKKKDNKLVPMSTALKNSRIEVSLRGKVLKGDYALVRIESKEGNEWLLIKMKDKYANARRKPASTHTRSSLTNRTMYQIAKEG